MKGSAEEMKVNDKREPDLTIGCVALNSHFMERNTEVSWSQSCAQANSQQFIFEQKVFLEDVGCS